MDAHPNLFWLGGSLFPDTSDFKEHLLKEKMFEQNNLQNIDNLS